MSRRGNSVRLSFFAFQDIITAVCGIVLVIVLLLALELNPDSPSLSTPGDRGEAIVVDVEQLKALEVQLAALRSEATAFDETIRTASKLGPAELARAKTAAQQRLEEVEARKDSLAGEVSNAAYDADRLEGVIEAREGDFATLASIESRNSDLEIELAEATSDERPIFVFPQGKSRDGWIVVVDRGKIRVAPIGRAAPPQEFPAALSDLSSFYRWASGQSKDYLLVLCRPSGWEPFGEIQHRFETSGRPFGYDLISESTPILDDVKGAGR